MCILLFVMWFLLVGFLGHQQARSSDRLSKNMAEVAIVVVDVIHPEANYTIDGLNRDLRNFAHVGVYMIMAFLLANVLSLRKIGTFKAFVLALIVTIILGILDEIRQIYVPGRGYEIKDIILDSYGSLIGSSLFLLTKINQFIYTKIRRRFRSDAIPQGGSYGR